MSNLPTETAADTAAADASHESLMKAAAAAARRDLTTPERVAVSLDTASAADAGYIGMEALRYLAERYWINDATDPQPFTEFTAPTFSRDLAAVARVLRHDQIWKAQIGNPTSAAANLLRAVALDLDTNPHRVAAAAQELASALLGHVTTRYATQCYLALFYIEDPNGGIGITPHVYTVDGVTHEAYSYEHQDNLITGWRYSPDGWSYTLQRFDTPDERSAQTLAGLVEWHPLGGPARPTHGEFITLAEAAKAKHPWPVTA